MMDPEIQRAIERLPRLSPGVFTLLQLLAKPAYSMAEVTAPIKNDVFLTAELLRAANSASATQKKPVGVVDQAIAISGPDAVVGVCTGLAMRGMMSVAMPAYTASSGGLWQHSLRTAIISAELVRFGAKAGMGTDAAFTSGILHDVGKLAFSSIVVGSKMDIRTEKAKGIYSSHLDMERGLAGMDHGGLGGEVARAWGLPAILAQVMEFHHFPAHAAAEYRRVVYAVHLADYLAMAGGFGTGMDSLHYPIDEGYKEYFDLTDDDVQKIVLTADAGFKRVAAIYLTPVNPIG